jgi:hypothetical protein
VSVEGFLYCCGRFARQFLCGIGYDPTALPASPRGERAVFEEDKFSRHDSEKFAIRRWEFAMVHVLTKSRGLRRAIDS